jgi:acyl carrier protein
MQDAEVRAKLRTFITTELIRNASYPLRDDEGVCSTGLIDSFALAEIGVFAEQEFGVYIPDPDLTVARMDTLDLMVARVMRGAGAGG